jgi:hypothetical protein
MNDNRFREQMEKLEQERDAYIKQLSPESQQEYRQKEDEFKSKLNPKNDSPGILPGSADFNK